MLVGKRSCGYGRARGKFAPVRCTTLLLSFRLTASPLGPGSHPIPRRRNPFPWSSRSPGSLPPPNVVPPRRQFSLVLPPSPPHPTRRGVPVFPYSRFAAPESALHRRRINTGRHPNSLEVNASFPWAPTTSTSYLPYPTISFQKPDEGSRPCGEATSTSDEASVGPDRTSETTRRDRGRRDNKCRVHR